MELQGISLKASQPGQKIAFEVASQRERRCVDKLNKFMIDHDGEINMTASANGQPDKHQLCRELIKVVWSSNLPSYDKTELVDFLGAQALRAKREPILGRALGGVQ